MKSILTRSIAAAAVLTLGIVSAQAGKAPEKDIVDTAVAAGSFNTLATWAWSTKPASHNWIGSWP